MFRVCLLKEVSCGNLPLTFFPPSLYGKTLTSLCFAALRSCITIFPSRHTSKKQRVLVGKYILQQELKIFELLFLDEKCVLSQLSLRLSGFLLCLGQRRGGLTRAVPFVVSFQYHRKLFLDSVDRVWMSAYLPRIYEQTHTVS